MRASTLRVGRLANVTLEGFEDVNAKIEALVDSQIRTDENLRRTDKSLRNLIAVVDRYLAKVVMASESSRVVVE